MRISAALRLIGTSAFALFAAPALAQTQPEATAQAANQAAAQTAPVVEDRSEIIVTATKRASRVQDVPFSINAQTQADIQRANAQTLEDISRNVASLTVQNLGPGQSQVSVRGVSAGQIVRDQPGVKEQVGIYLDESIASLSLFTPDFDLFDLNRVETLRGPQGTLFGAGSVGGTIRYITNQPKLDVVEGQVEGGINFLKGGDIGWDAKAAINMPIANTLAARVVGYYTHFGGFIDAVGPAAGNNINDGERFGTRVSLLWQPVPEVKVTPRLVFQRATANGFNREEHYNLYDNQFTTGAAGTDLGRRTVFLRLPERFRDQTTLMDLTASYDFGPAELTSVTSKMLRDILVSRDASALTGSVGVSFTGLGVDRDVVQLTSNLRDTTKLNQFTQELRLASTGAGPFHGCSAASTATSTATINNGCRPLAMIIRSAFRRSTDCACSQACLFVAGRSDDTEEAANGFPLDSPYNADLPYVIKQKALFGEASYKFGQFKLTAGGRWYDFKERRNFISGGVFSNRDTRIGDRTKSNGFSPRGIVSWEPARNLSVNAQVAKGFRLGGVNDPLNIPLCEGGPTARSLCRSAITRRYKDETLWNYEAGVKYSRHGITFNAAAFYNDIKNLQVTADAGSCSSRVVFNVPKAHTQGVEAEFAVHPHRRPRPVPSRAACIERQIRLDAATRPAIPTSRRSPAFATAIACRRFRNISSRRPRPMARSSAPPANGMYGSVQRIGNRYTQPSDQEAGAGLVTMHLLRSGRPATSAPAPIDFGSLQAAALHAGQRFARPEVGQRAGDRRLCQEHLRRESEAVARS